MAIDSLEYEIAKNFSHLTQTEFGKTIVPLANGEEPYTPVVWGSFITGLTPVEHGIFEGPALKWNSSTLQKLKAFMEKSNFYGRYHEGVGNLMVKLGFKMTPDHIFHTKEDFKSKNIQTIFDFAKKPVVISVPSYNEERVNQYLRRRLFDVHRKGLPEKVLEEEAWEVFYKRLQNTMEKLDEDWDLFMVHFFIVDTFGHLYPKYNPSFERLYNELDEIVDRIKKKMRDTFIFVVSDHGHQNCHHTPYGFYSSNEILGLHYPSITDFHQIILEVLSR